MSVLFTSVDYSLTTLIDRFLSRIQKLVDFAADQPTKSLDKAVFWIEYVIRHKGARHLRSPAIDAPFYKYYLLDVLALLTLCVLLFFYLVLKCFKRIWAFVKAKAIEAVKRKVE